MKSSPLTRASAVLAAAMFVIIGSIAGSPVYASPAAPQSLQSSAAANAESGNQAVWAPYDRSAIKSSSSCESRRSWLIANVDWIKTGNSRCQKFTQSTCGSSSSYWYVMVLSPDGARIADPREVAPVVAAC